jgi:hypothetical protein
MRYMLLIYDAFGEVPEEEQQAIMGEYFAYSEEIDRAGIVVASEALHPVETAKSVRLRDGERLVTDGPFAETRETLGGFYMVDVDSEEEALEWAARIPSARFGTVEVRRTVVFDREQQSVGA